MREARPHQSPRLVATPHSYPSLTQPHFSTPSSPQPSPLHPTRAPTMKSYQILFHAALFWPGRKLTTLSALILCGSIPSTHLTYARPSFDLGILSTSRHQCLEWRTHGTSSFASIALRLSHCPHGISHNRNPNHSRKNLYLELQSVS